MKWAQGFEIFTGRYQTASDIALAMGKAIKENLETEHWAEQYFEYEFKLELLRPAEELLFRKLSILLQSIPGLQLRPHPLLWQGYIAEHPVDINPYQQVFSILWLHRAAKCGKYSNDASEVFFPRLPTIAQQKECRRYWWNHTPNKFNYIIFQPKTFQESFQDAFDWHINWANFWYGPLNTFHGNGKKYSAFHFEKNTN